MLNGGAEADMIVSLSDCVDFLLWRYVHLDEWSSIC